MSHDNGISFSKDYSSSEMTDIAVGMGGSHFSETGIERNVFFSLRHYSHPETDITT